jgi:hypothetical protein
VTYRLLVIVAAAVVAAAAPARAWCEASCIVPTNGTQAHCPSHDPADARTQISGSAIDECPVLESARPAASARLEVQAAAVVTVAPDLNPQSHLVFSPARPGSASTVFERHTPLRI